MRALLNAMSERAQSAIDRKATSTPGIVTSYNPNTYSVKVQLQPDGTETGWLPLLSQQVGNGWGLYCPPGIGDLVHVVFTDGEIEAGVVAGAYYNNVEVPLAVPSQEIWWVHKSGSRMKFLTNGDVELDTVGNLTANVAGSTTLTSNGTTINSNVQLNGNLRVSGQISDLNTSHGTVADLRAVYDTHTHPGIQSGGSSTGTTSEPL
jgi:phage baseplate assembly protein gpV